MALKTLKDFIAERDLLLEEHWQAFKKAPQRGTYNRVIGGYSQGKSNISQATKSNLRELNTLCEARGLGTIWDDEEKDVGLKGKAVDPE
jgi:hypothetical protein